MTMKWMDSVVKETDRMPRGDAAGETRGETVERKSHREVNLVMTATKQNS